MLVRKDEDKKEIQEIDLNGNKGNVKEVLK